MTCICHFIFFVSFPESPVGISDVGSFPVWSGWSLIICQLFRCRNLVINRMFSYIRGRHGGCQLRGHPYAPIHLYTSCTFIHTLYVCMPHTSVFPIPLYICMFFYVPHMSWGLGGICTPHVSWGLLGVSVHLTGISVSVSTSICSQFITVMPVAPHHCGLLLYWTGCLWLSAMSCCHSFLCSFHYVSHFYYHCYDCWAGHSP